jgi:hypothetical protein
VSCFFFIGFLGKTRSFELSSLYSPERKERSSRKSEPGVYLLLFGGPVTDTDIIAPNDLRSPHLQNWRVKLVAKNRYVRGASGRHAKPSAKERNP